MKDNSSKSPKKSHSRKKHKELPFWEQNLNPITMLPPIRYEFEQASQCRSSELPTINRAFITTALSERGKHVIETYYSHYNNLNHSKTYKKPSNNQ